MKRFIISTYRCIVYDFLQLHKKMCMDLRRKIANGRVVKLKEYKGKVLLIVNTATKCGFTPQYEALQKLYDTYKAQGLVILDVSM